MDLDKAPPSDWLVCGVDEGGEICNMIGGESLDARQQRLRLEHTYKLARGDGLRRGYIVGIILGVITIAIMRYYDVAIKYVVG